MKEHKNKHVRRKILNIATHPGQLMTKYLGKHYKKYYHEKHDYPRIVFSLDLMILGVLIGFIATVLTFFLFARVSVANQIDFTATIAPTEIKSGSPSTLIINWHNTSEEELRNVEIEMSFPNHFRFDYLTFLDNKIENRTISIGSIDPDGSGSLKVAGVMFGDVGGEQTFTSNMTFRYGDKNRKQAKTATHTFSPTASAISIKATVPTFLVSSQTVNGLIHLENTSKENFGQVSVQPTRSDFNFILSPDAKDIRESKTDDQLLWTIDELRPGETADIPFIGIAPTRDFEVKEDWAYSAFFTFDETQYYQGTTNYDFTLIPSPLIAEHSVDTPALTPGGTASVNGIFRNVSAENLNQMEFFVEADSPFFSRRNAEGVTYNAAEDRWYIDQMPNSLDASDEIEFHVKIPIRTNILQSSTDTYDNLYGAIRVGSKFTLESSAAKTTILSNPITLPITSPVVISALGRYSTVLGDQIGRGPLPPVVGEETKYWVFLNVRGTTNELKDVEITATLPNYARGGEKQTVSIGNKVQFTNNQARWTIDKLSPTFAPGSKIVGIAFEVAITPEDHHAGEIITILDNITFTAKDSLTGAIIKGYGARITTSLPDDDMASGLSRVEF